MSALEALVWDFIRFGFGAIVLGVVVAVMLPESSASAMLIVGGMSLMFAGVVGVFVVRWWNYREGNDSS